MEIIRLEEAKEYCDKHNVERNEWVAGTVDRVLAGTHFIQYRNEDGYLHVIDAEYLNSHMQSLKGFDESLNIVMAGLGLAPLKHLQRDQAMLTIGELADDWEIGK